MGSGEGGGGERREGRSGKEGGKGEWEESGRGRREDSRGMQREGKGQIFIATHAWEKSLPP